MSEVSDRRHDAFDNPAKMTCREGNLRTLREAAFLLWEDGNRTRLRCDWCELMGATGLLTLDKLCGRPHNLSSVAVSVMWPCVRFSRFPSHFVVFCTT
jgi:hypothetical protein